MDLGKTSTDDKWHLTIPWARSSQYDDSAKFHRKIPHVLRTYVTYENVMSYVRTYVTHEIIMFSLENDVTYENVIYPN